MLPRLTANDYSSWPRGDPPNLGAFCKARSHNHFGHFLSISSMMKAGHGFSAEPRCLRCLRLRRRSALFVVCGYQWNGGRRSTTKLVCMSRSATFCGISILD
jgi:hypothetical protein